MLDRNQTERAGCDPTGLVEAAIPELPPVQEELKEGAGVEEISNINTGGLSAELIVRERGLAERERELRARERILVHRERKYEQQQAQLHGSGQRAVRPLNYDNHADVILSAPIIQQLPTQPPVLHKPLQSSVIRGSAYSPVKPKPRARAIRRRRVTSSNPALRLPRRVYSSPQDKRASRTVILSNVSAPQLNTNRGQSNRLRPRLRPRRSPLVRFSNTGFPPPSHTGGSRQRLRGSYSSPSRLSKNRSNNSKEAECGQAIAMLNSMLKGVHFNSKNNLFYPGAIGKEAQVFKKEPKRPEADFKITKPKKVFKNKCVKAAHTLAMRAKNMKRKSDRYMRRLFKKEQLVEKHIGSIQNSKKLNANQQQARNAYKQLLIFDSSGRSNFLSRKIHSVYSQRNLNRRSNQNNNANDSEDESDGEKETTPKQHPTQSIITTDTATVNDNNNAILSNAINANVSDIHGSYISL